MSLRSQEMVRSCEVCLRSQEMVGWQKEKCIESPAKNSRLAPVNVYIDCRRCGILRHVRYVMPHHMQTNEATLIIFIFPSSSSLAF